jgi:hypothetical protein
MSIYKPLRFVYNDYIKSEWFTLDLPATPPDHSGKGLKFQVPIHEGEYTMIYVPNKTPAITNFYKALHNGQSFTSKEIMKRFRVDNPRDLVYRLRNEGENIVSEKKVLKRGTPTVTVYRLENLENQHVGLENRSSGLAA